MYKFTHIHIPLWCWRCSNERDSHIRGSAALIENMSALHSFKCWYTRCNCVEYSTHGYKCGPTDDPHKRRCGSCVSRIMWVAGLCVRTWRILSPACGRWFGSGSDSHSNRATPLATYSISTSPYGVQHHPRAASRCFDVLQTAVDVRAESTKGPGTDRCRYYSLAQKADSFVHSEAMFLRSSGRRGQP